MRLTTSFLRPYWSAGRPVARSERVLAVGRAFLTVSGFAAIYLDPTEPARLREITYAVLLAYAVYSLGVLAFVHSALRLTQAHGHALHALDILWTSALTFVSEGPVSPFFLFFLFVVLAAAYRWGFRETVATFDLQDALTLGVDGIQRHFEPLVRQVETWRAQQLSDERAKLLIYEAFVEGALEGLRSLARPVHEAYFSPKQA